MKISFKVVVFENALLVNTPKKVIKNNDVNHVHRMHLGECRLKARGKLHNNELNEYVIVPLFKCLSAKCGFTLHYSQIRKHILHALHVIHRHKHQTPDAILSLPYRYCLLTWWQRQVQVWHITMFSDICADECKCWSFKNDVM